MDPRERQALSSLGISDNYEGDNFAGKMAVLRNFKYFKFRVVNAAGSAVKLALHSAFFNTLKVTSTATSTFTGTQASLSGDAQNCTPAGTVATTVANVVSFNDVTNINNAGHAIDAVLDDGVSKTDLTITASRLKVRDLVEFTKFNRCILTEMVINADNTAAFNEEIKVVKASPFRSLGDDLILQLNDFIDTKQQIQTKCVVDFFNQGHVVQLDEQTLPILTVGASRTLDITLKIALIDNASANFNAMVKKAAR